MNTKKDYLEEVRERHEKEMAGLLASPDPIKEFAERVYYICKISDGYLFNITGEFSLGELMEILHGHKYSINGYHLYGTNKLEIRYQIGGSLYDITVLDAEAVLPIVGGGKCRIEEKETTNTSRTIVCEMGE